MDAVRTLWILLVCVLCGCIYPVRGQDDPSTTNTDLRCPGGTERGGPLGNNCVPCRYGYYRNASHSSNECTPCPEQYITGTEGATHVDNCTVHVGSRGNCPSGTEWVSDNEDCQPCPIGTYRTQGTQFWCLRCPNGRLTTANGAISLDNCTVEDCPSGSQWVVKTKRCERCPRNSYRERGEHRPCQECQPYHVTLQRGASSRQQCFELPHSDSLFQIPDDCPSGTNYSVILGVCHLCPKNYYRQAGVDPTCLPCPNGHVTLKAGAISASLCVTREQLQQLPLRDKYDLHCPDGTEWQDHDLAGCYPCSLGTYRSGNESRLCQFCPEGKTTPAVGAMSQDLCGLEEVKDTSTVFTRDECPPGTAWPSNNKTEACLICQPGHFSPDGQYCAPCPIAKTTLYHGSRSLRECMWSTGKYKEQPYFDSDQCPLGSEWDFEANGCKPCPGGLYRSRFNTASCKPCSPGTTTLRPGAKSEKLCNVPLEGPNYSPLTHDGCDVGYEVSSDNSTCKLCQDGFYKSEVSWTRCEHCPVDASGHHGFTNFAGATHINDCLQDIVITGLSPSYGPQAGGTDVIVSIDAVLPFRVDEILLAEYSCWPKSNYFRNGELVCTTSPARSLADGPLNMSLVNYNKFFASTQSFVYKPDPELNISSIKRLKSFVSGGLVLTVQGTNMQSVTKPVMMLKNKRPSLTEKRTQWPCYIMSPSRMECPLPDVSESGVRLRRSFPLVVEEGTLPQQYDMGFRMDGQMKYTNLTDQLGLFQIYPNPSLDPLSNNVASDIENNGGKLEITGRRLNLACTPKDYVVSVGSECTAGVEDLAEDHMVCTVCEGLKLGVKHHIVVRVGSLTFNIGYIHLPKPAVSFLVPLLVTLALILLIIAVIVGICLYSRRRRHVAKSESVQGLTSADCSSIGSIGKQSSIESGIPPLPVDSIFGPEPRRLTDKGVAMRPLALPSDGLSVQLVEQTNKGKLLRYNVTWDEANDSRFSALSMGSDISGLQTERHNYLEILPALSTDVPVTS